jgi:hypothetical protein
LQSGGSWVIRTQLGARLRRACAELRTTERNKGFGSGTTTGKRLKILWRIATSVQGERRGKEAEEAMSMETNHPLMKGSPLGVEVPHMSTAMVRNMQF